MGNLIRIVILLTILLTLLITGCSKESEVAREVAQRLENQENLTQVVVCYPADGMLIEETRDIEESEFNPTGAIRQIFEAENYIKKHKPIIPATKVIDVKTESGIAVISFERSVLKFKASELNQRLVVAAITSTLSQFPNIEKVKLQVEGREKGKIGGKDIETFWGKVTLKEQPWKVK